MKLAFNYLSVVYKLFGRAIVSSSSLHHKFFYMIQFELLLVTGRDFCGKILQPKQERRSESNAQLFTLFIVVSWLGACASSSSETQGKLVGMMRYLRATRHFEIPKVYIKSGRKPALRPKISRAINIASDNVRHVIPSFYETIESEVMNCTKVSFENFRFSRKLTSGNRGDISRFKCLLYVPTPTQFEIRCKYQQISRLRFQNKSFGPKNKFDVQYNIRYFL